MQGHKILNRKEYKAGYFDVEDLTIKHGSDDGKKEKIYSIMRHPDWVNVVAETKDKQIILVNQWRAGVDDMCIEVPGGKVDEGEEPIEAGLRELREETGYVTTSESRIVYLGKVFANPAIQDNSMHFVYVSNVEPNSETDMDEFELVYTKVCDRRRVVSMLQDEEIKHAYSSLALHKALIG